jgi:hypothetical protein
LARSPRFGTLDFLDHLFSLYAVGGFVGSLSRFRKEIKETVLKRLGLFVTAPMSHGFLSFRFSRRLGYVCVP